MKKLIYSLSLVLAMVACQHQTPPVQMGSDISTKKPVIPVKTDSLSPDILTPYAQTLLRRCDFSKILQTVQADDAGFGSHAQNGFFGPDHYRIEVAMTEVRRDLAHPTVYHLRGKSRYKGVITPFAGVFTVTHLFDQPHYSAEQIAKAKAERGDELLPGLDMYTTIGDFELREETGHRGAGVFQGRLAIDWQLWAGHGLRMLTLSDTTASQGSGIKYEGRWIDTATHRTYPVVWVEHILPYVRAQHVLEDFASGDRDVEINPKYAKLGWNSYWENDEWWADSPKPSLSL